MEGLGFKSWLAGDVDMFGSGAPPTFASTAAAGAEQPFRTVSVDPDKSTERVFVCVIELWFTPIGGEGEVNMGYSLVVT